MSPTMNRPLIKQLIVSTTAVCALAGCATSGNPKDPIEGFNRSMFTVNEALDKAVMKPVAKGYEAAVPKPVRNGVANFYGNIADVSIGVNSALQGKVPDAINDFGRVMVNSSLGILGFMDVASDLGVEKHEQDFGLTLAHWGIGSGAYIVLPVFGPRTVRDSFGLVLDLAADPVGRYGHVAARNVMLTSRMIDERTALFPAEKVLDEAAMDKYSYIRDAYLQRRRYLVYGGNPPRLDDTPD